MFWGPLGFGDNMLLMRVLLQPIYEGTQSAAGFQWAQKREGSATGLGRRKSSFATRALQASGVNGA